MSPYFQMPGVRCRREVTPTTGGSPKKLTAVLNDEKGSYVLIVNDKNKVERRAVRVSGIVKNGVTIAAGIANNVAIEATMPL